MTPLITCDHCGVRYDPATLHRCEQASHDSGSILSDPDEMLDKLIEQNSIPNLGALIKGAKDAGLVKAKQAYTNA